MFGAPEDLAPCPRFDKKTDKIYHIVVYIARIYYNQRI